MAAQPTLHTAQLWQFSKSQVVANLKQNSEEEEEEEEEESTKTIRLGHTMREK